MMELASAIALLESMYLRDQRAKRPIPTSTETQALRTAVEALGHLQGLIGIVTYQDSYDR